MPTKPRQARKGAAVSVVFVCRWTSGMELTAAWMLFPGGSNYGARPLKI